MYKIILKNNNNAIANTIYSKINNIKNADKIWLINNLKKYVYNHLILPLYETKDIEKIVYDYGIQKAYQHFILNKKIYNDIMLMMNHDETKVIFGIAFLIIYEHFEFRIIDI